MATLPAAALSFAGGAAGGASAAAGASAGAPSSVDGAASCAKARRSPGVGYSFVDRTISVVAI